MLAIVTLTFRSIFHLYFVACVELFIHHLLPIRIGKKLFMFMICLLAIAKEMFEELIGLKSGLGSVEAFARDGIVLLAVIGSLSILFVLRSKLSVKVLVASLFGSAVFITLISFLCSLIFVKGIQTQSFKHIIDIISLTLAPVLATPILEKWLIEKSEKGIKNGNGF